MVKKYKNKFIAIFVYVITLIMALGCISLIQDSEFTIYTFIALITLILSSYYMLKNEE